MAEKGSDMNYDFCCNLCEEDDINKEAMFYCQQCSKGFCEDCIGRHKQFYKKHVAYGRGERDKWPVATKSLEDLTFCEQHPDHLIEMFCEDHSKLCCALCLFHDHRHCVKLVLIQDESQAIHDAGECLNISSAIADVQQKLETAINDTQECLKKLQGSYDKAYDEIKVLHQKINDILDELERKTIHNLDTLLQTLKQSLQTDTDTCSKAINGLKKISDAINNIEKGPNDLSFIAYQKGLEIGSQAEKLLKELTINRIPLIAFNKHPCIEQTLSDMSTLGNIECLEKQADKDENNILECKSKYLHDVRIRSDEETCDIRGICELSNGDILIVDFGNNSVKILDMQYTIVAHADLSDFPSDICTISPTEVAVTFYGFQNNRIVQFLNVKDRQIVKERKLDFKHICLGIAYFKNTLFITSRFALYQYTLDGQLVKKIYEDTAGFNSVYRCAVDPDGSRLYVTNFKHNTLLTLTMDGTVQSSLEDPVLSGPAGFHVSEKGHILVCGCRSHNLVQVDVEGGMVALASTEDGLNYPNSVYYSARTGRLIVGHKSDNILVINTK